MSDRRTTEARSPRLARLLRASPLLALALILSLSAFLQFYRLDDLQHFQGDEGSLVLAARALIVAHQFPVHGLSLAVGSAHLGPLFDYLIVPPLWLSGLNPTAAVALNGICQVLAVGLCYGLMIRYGGGRLAGLVAALVLATAQEVVYYSRFLWPNMLPCMVVLIFWSLLALRDGRQSHLALLGIWLGVALQLQPTAVLLIPFLALYLLLFRPPIRRRGVRYALLGALAFLALFAPAIAHDLTHGLVETRAWLGYSHHGNAHDRAIGPTVARILVLLQRLVGVQQGLPAALLGVTLVVGVAARALLPETGKSDPARGATLARLLLLYSAVCLAGYLFFGSQLRPHYAMPLFPVPALALGLLAGAWPGRHGSSAGLTSRVQPPDIARRVAVAVVAVVLGASNVEHTWQAGFLLDRYQITLKPEGANRITLGQMRQVSSYIVRQAAGRRFNLVFAASSDTPDAYEALLLAAGGRLSLRPATLRFLVVEPPTWPASHWPMETRRLAACAGSPSVRFAAALVWTLAEARACQARDRASSRCHTMSSGCRQGTMSMQARRAWHGGSRPMPQPEGGAVWRKRPSWQR